MNEWIVVNIRFNLLKIEINNLQYFCLFFRDQANKIAFKKTKTKNQHEVEYKAIFTLAEHKIFY